MGLELTDTPTMLKGIFIYVVIAAFQMALRVKDASNGCYLPAACLFCCRGITDCLKTRAPHD
jgi:hypothetical protein